MNERVPGAHTCQKGALGFMKSELQIVVNHFMGAGIKPRFSGRAVSAHSYWAISPDPLPVLDQGEGSRDMSYPGLLMLAVEVGHVEVIQVNQQVLFTHLTGLYSTQICSWNQQ